MTAENGLQHGGMLKVAQRASTESNEQPEILSHANQPVTGELRVTGADGKPCTKLEPTMSAFAHLVAFHQDGVTVLHIHPQGTGLLAPADRGGPVLRFHFYAPKPGFYRLFSQVQLGGEQKYAPFGIEVK